jgi:hypothetical protein
MILCPPEYHATGCPFVYSAGSDSFSFFATPLLAVTTRICFGLEGRQSSHGFLFSRMTVRFSARHDSFRGILPLFRFRFPSPGMEKTSETLL